jgi:hypothetical protein
MPDLNHDYEAKHLKQIAARLRRIKALYGEAIDRISIVANSIVYRGVTFQLKDYPLLKKLIKDEIKTLHGSILIEITDGIKTSWGLSNEKNDLLVDKRLAGKVPRLKAKQILYDPNEAALKEFIKRKEKGLGLSDRVWSTLDPLHTELEKGLAVGISEGRSAAEMARDLKQYLNNPDKLFRRVRDSGGELKLSRAAKAYKPGQGVYRSSFKNSLRLTATETNMAYRSSDFERWNNLAFVVGMEVKLSGQHPKLDVCDAMAGRYPKDYKFVGNHPFCICYSVPILASDSDYNKIEDAILGISDSPPDIKQVESIPASAKRWVEQNAEKIKGWKSKPYFIKNNPEYLNKYLK